MNNTHKFKPLYLTIAFGLGIALFFSLNAHTAPRLINSYGEEQLPGIKVSNISSFSLTEEGLLISDTTQQVHLWKEGKKPVLFQQGTQEQRFTSAFKISNQKFVLTDEQNSQLLISDNGKWQHFATEGDQEGELKKPVASARSANGMIYVAEEGNDRISVFSEDGLFLFTFGNDADSGNKDQNLDQISSITTDQTGRVYVLDNTNLGRVSIYSELGKLYTSLGKEEFKLLVNDSIQLSAMTVRPDGTLILADKKNGYILEVDWENLELISQFGSTGRARGQFKRVSNLAVDDDGKLYIADRGNAKIEVFQLDGKTTPWLNLDEDKMSIRPASVLKSACDISYIYYDEQMLCLQDSSNGSVSIRKHDGTVKQVLSAKFTSPLRAVFDENEILILDKSDIKVFDKQGNLKFTIGNHGRRSGEIIAPSDIALTANAVYVADTGNERVQVFSRNGLFKMEVGNTRGAAHPLKEPTAVTVDTLSNIYVADKELNRVLVYSPSGEFTAILGLPEDHLHEFTHIHDITTDKSDILYIMAATSTNPLSVWAYENNELTYRFSPHISEVSTAVAGIDSLWKKTFAADEKLSIPSLLAAAEESLNQVEPIQLDLTSEAVVKLFSPDDSLFGNDKWIFNHAPNNPSVIALLNLSKHERLTFSVAKAPKQIPDIRISGDEENVSLSWLPPHKHFSGYYTLYARKDVSTPFKAIRETRTPEVHDLRSKLDFNEFRVSAVSPLSKESKLSPVAKDSFWLGYQAYQKKEFTLAQDLLAEAAAANPKHPFAWLYLGKAQVALQQFDKASSTYAKLSQFEEWKQKSLHLQAQVLIEKHAWLELKLLVDNAEAGGHIDATLYSLGAKALTALDDVPSAIFYLNQAVALEPDSPIWHIKLANANFVLGATKNAKAELLTAEKLAGTNAQYWFNIAQSYSQHELYNQAASSYNNALQHDPNHAGAISELAMLYINTKKLAEARTIATRMAGIEGLKGTSYHILGLVALKEDKAPQSLAMLAKAGDIEPNNSLIWLSMANAYAALQKPDQEVNYLNKAVAIDDNNFEIHMRLAQACSGKKDFECAQKHYSRAAAIDEKSTPAHLGLANALKDGGKLSQANEHADIALKLEPNSIPAHLILADIYRARGMIPNSIATLKKALSLDAANMDVHLALSRAYIENQMYTEAIATTEKAILLDIRDPAPLMLSGSIYLARQSFDDAIKAFEKAVELAPTNADYQRQLNIAYLQKKRSVDAGGNIVGPKLKNLAFSAVFAAAYKQYTEVPIGTVALTNESGIDFTNVKISIFVKEFMDFPTTETIEHIPAGGTMNISLNASFSNKILNIDEDTGVQTEIRAEYYLAGKPHVETLNEPMTIYGKNAIIWENLDMVGSFTTPKDQTLSTFIRQLLNSYTPKKNGAINSNVLKAMTVYNGLSAYGIRYIADPNTPYNKLKSTQLDTIQFPRETLHQRSGDCDDLSILLASALANLGIETAILDVPEHLLMMFNTGVDESHKNSISVKDDAFAIINGQVWIPLEATLISSTFSEAWAEGARKYHLYSKASKLKRMLLADAWEKYPPVTLAPASYNLTIPTAAEVGTKISKEWTILAIKALERKVHPYRIMLSLDPNNEQAQMQIAVVYARNGLYESAITELEAIKAKTPNSVAALNNLGNIHFMQQRFPDALSLYQQASNLQPNNSGILINIAMTHYKMGDALQAKTVFDNAAKIDEQVPSKYQQFDFILHQ